MRFRVHIDTCRLGETGAKKVGNLSPLVLEPRFPWTLAAAVAPRRFTIPRRLSAGDVGSEFGLALVTSCTNYLLSPV